MVTSDDQKVRLATQMLAEKAAFWWANSRRRLEAGGFVVSLEMFKEVFLKKYFPADLSIKKEVVFLQLKQRSMSVTQYAVKFVELSQFCLYINAEGVKDSKSIMF